MKRQKSSKAQKIIARYALKNGLVCYRIETAETVKVKDETTGQMKSEVVKRYHCCTKQVNGTWKCMGDEECKGQKYTKSHTCCHVELAKAHEDAYYRNGILIDPEEVVEETAPAATTTEEVAQLAQEVRRHVEHYAAKLVMAEQQEVDPWAGLSEEEKYVAWRNFELALAS